MRLRIFLFGAVIALALVSPSALGAQSPIVVKSQTLDMNFPRAMRFTIQAESSAPLQELRLTVWQHGVALGSRFTPPFTPAKNVRATFEWDFQSFSSGGYLPPGTRGEYTWHLVDAAGNVLDTPRTSYIVSDPTQKWSVLSNDDLRVSWYVGDAAFGAAVFERAILAREFLAKDLGIENVDALQVFIYADKQDFFESLPPFSAEWTGGRTFPEYGVIMINFAPDNLDWGLRATSHELSHAILHAKIRGTIGELSIPHWLDEGLAVYNETNDHAPDAQFEEAFQPAVRHNALIPLRSMQLRFPDDSGQAQLAYGQSFSVVKFMIEEYGKEKFAALLDIYEKGSSPDEGLTAVYGMDQDELENAWRKKIGAPPREFSSARLPTLAPRPTYEFSSPLETVTVAVPQATSTPEATRAALLATPPPASAIPAQAPQIPVSGLCGGVLMLSGIVAFTLRRPKNQIPRNTNQH